MEQIDLLAQRREETGKGVSGRLRRSGMVPAVLYGPGIKGAVPITLNNKELEKTLHTTAGENVLVNLNIEGAKKPRTVMFKEIVRYPVSGFLQHVDLLEVVMDQKVTVEVPVHCIGKAEGVALGGILQTETRQIKVECLPAQIPESIDLDVIPLAIGQSVHVKDLDLPEGVVPLEDPDLTVVSIQAPAVEVVEKPAEEVEAEAAAPAEEKAEEGGE